MTVSIFYKILFFLIMQVCHGVQVAAEGVVSLELELQVVLCSQTLTLELNTHPQQEGTPSPQSVISDIICKQKDAKDTNRVLMTLFCCTPHLARMSLQLKPSDQGVEDKES